MESLARDKHSSSLKKFVLAGGREKSNLTLAPDCHRSWLLEMIDFKYNHKIQCALDLQFDKRYLKI